MIFKKTFFLFLSFIFTFLFLAPVENVYGQGQLSNAQCSITVSVNNTTGAVTITGRATEGSPGRDPSSAYVTIYDTAGGPGASKNGIESAQASYNFTVTENNTYFAYVEGTTSSNPNGGSSTCFRARQFTVDVPSTKTLDVSKSGSGSGTVNGPGINCGSGSGCNESYNHGTNVTLTANPSSGSTFAGWSGACSGTGSCNLSMTANRNVTATFTTSAPGPFSIGSGGCFDWPNPKIENNPNPSSGATSYSLYRRENGGSWQLIADHWWIGDIDRYGNPVTQYQEYEYYVMAYNNSGGSTRSSNTPYYYAGPSQCGQVLYTLSTSVASGSGSISGTGISCPGDCSHSTDSGNWVTVTAQPASGYAFGGWSGACAGQGASCSLYMDGNKSTSANFGANSYTLSVSKSGSGTVNGSGISCGSDCSETYNYGTSVVLTASPDSGQSFAGWSGACSGTGSCTVSMTAARSVTASFGVATYNLSVSKNGTGSGTVSANTGSVNCGSTCSGSYTHGTSVTLTPVATAGSGFVGWAGACSGSGSCVVSMTQARSVTATFNIVPFNYSLSNNGNVSVTKGSGTTYGQSVITKNLTGGVAQPVSLSVSGVPSGVSYGIANETCSPTCSSTITFNVSSSATVGTHGITVTGSSPSRQTSFNLNIAGAPIGVVCSATPNPAVLGQTVNWSAQITGGVAPLSYSWSGTNIPVAPAPSTAAYSQSYSTLGEKTASLRVSDADGVVATCPVATVEITFDPNFEEF